jgi:hypothetical protein
MVSSAVDPAISGLEVIDLEDYPAFSARPTRPPNPAAQILFIERLAKALLEDPDSILQWLVDSALDMCGADSAGISAERYLEHYSNLETDYETGVGGFQWVATAGQYGPLLDAVFPRKPSACDICLGRGRPQLYRISEPFLHSIGVDAARVTDGLMVPWDAEGRRGTIWILAHGRTEAFDQRNLETLEFLARFAALCVTQQHRRKQKDYEWAVVAASAVIKVLALRIHDPLQELSDVLFLAENGRWDGTATALAQRLSQPLSVLNNLVDESLGQMLNPRPN